MSTIKQKQMLLIQYRRPDILLTSGRCGTTSKLSLKHSVHIHINVDLYCITLECIRMLKLAYGVYEVRYYRVCASSINALCNNQLSRITVAVSSVWNRSQTEIVVSNTANGMSVCRHTFLSLCFHV
jgi:hypothetical protein